MKYENLGEFPGSILFYFSQSNSQLDRAQKNHVKCKMHAAEWPVQYGTVDDYEKNIHVY